MSVLKIRTFPDPVLRQKAKRIKTIDPTVKKLINNMIDTLKSCSGVGLAANQVGSIVRVVVIALPEQDIRVLINPEIIKKSGEQIAYEGCLSIPGYRAKLTRAQTVKIKALDKNGKEIRIKGEELTAQVLQHEIDHLNGIVYLDRLGSLDELEKINTDESSSES